MRDSNPTQWKELYLQALLESDIEKMTELVLAAEQAIVFRSQELLNSSDHHEERIEMKLAAADLLAIKTHKLGWPSVPVTAGQMAGAGLGRRPKLPKSWRRWLFGEHNIPFN